MTTPEVLLPNCHVSGMNGVKYPAHYRKHASGKETIHLVTRQGRPVHKSCAAVAELPAGPLALRALAKGGLRQPLGPGYAYTAVDPDLLPQIEKGGLQGATWWDQPHPETGKTLLATLKANVDPDRRVPPEDLSETNEHGHLIRHLEDDGEGWDGADRDLYHNHGWRLAGLGKSWVASHWEWEEDADGLGRFRFKSVLKKDANEQGHAKGEQADQGHQKGFLTGEEIKKLGLKWITVHPPRHPEGTPILVKDNGDHYVVVGGAGGKLNQLVLPKDAAKKKLSAEQRAKERDELKAHRAKEAEKKDPEAFQRLKENRGHVRSAIKQKTSGLRERVAGLLGEHARTEHVEAAARAEAEQQGITGKAADQFVRQALRAHHGELDRAVQRVVAHAVDRQAYRDLGVDLADLPPAELKAKLGKRQLVKQLSEGELQDLVAAHVDKAKLQDTARAVGKALRSGNLDRVRQFQDRIEAAEPTPAEVDAWTRRGYLQRSGVIHQTALVTESEKCSPQMQRQYQADGATDGLNDFLAEHTGQAVLDHDVVKELGVEGAARVAAAHLRGEAVDTEKAAQHLFTRVSQGGYAAAVAAITHALDLDALTHELIQSVEGADATMTTSQAYELAKETQREKFQMLNRARGALRGAAALAYALHHADPDAPLSVGGAGNAVAAHEKARSLGLGEGDYTVTKGKTGYDLNVPAGKISKLARPRAAADHQGEQRMRARWDAARQDPTWKPDGFTSDPDLQLQPHQQVGIKTIVEEKRAFLNEGPGAGKTAQYYGAASQLLHDGKIDHALITLPKAPRAQQGGDAGEAAKFLSPQMAAQVRVISSGKQLDNALAEIKGGEKLILVTSPQMARDQLGKLQAAGFGGNRSAYFTDEAHEIASGKGEDAAGLAQMRRTLAGSEYYAAGTGTGVRTGPDELWDVLDSVKPGAVGTRKQFRDRMARIAGGEGTNLFQPEAVAQFARGLAPHTVTYHAPPTRKGEDGRPEPVKLDREVETVPLHPLQKQAIQQAQNRAKLALKKEQDPGQRSAIHLRLHAQVQQIIHGGVHAKHGELVLPGTKGAEHIHPLADRAAQLLEEGRQDDPNYKVGYYSHTLAPLAGVQRRLQDRGRRVASVTGGNTDRDTARAVRSVNRASSNPEASDAVTFTRAGNAGLNMQGLRRIVMLGAGGITTPNLPRQIEGRHYRTGQEHDVASTTLLSDHPAEQQLYHRMSTQRAPTLKLLERAGLDQIDLAHALHHDESGLAETLAAHLKDILQHAGAQEDQALDLAFGRDYQAPPQRVVRSPFGKALSGLLTGAGHVYSLGKLETSLTHQMARCQALYEDATDAQARAERAAKHREAYYRGEAQRLRNSIQGWLAGDAPLNRNVAREMLQYLQGQSLIGRVSLARRAAHRHLGA